MRDACVYIGIQMYIALILLSLTFGVLIGIFTGYYITLSVFSFKMLGAEIKLMKWDESLFAYRPRSILRPIKQGEWIALKADEGIVDFINILMEREE